LIVPNPRFRPNPARAIYVSGEINEQMVQRLTPRIMLFQSQSRAPITVYIDSPGGQVATMTALWRLLNASNQDFEGACDIITVATSRAASVAADLLCAGDYALAFPQSTLLYHGARIFRDTLTVETTSVLASLLRMTNEYQATELARKIESRFMFRFVVAKSQFAEIRAKDPAKPMTDTECFLAAISNNLSEQTKNLLETARQRQGRYAALMRAVQKASKAGKTTAQIEAGRIRAIVNFELASNKSDKDWTFRGGGLTRLNEDFFLLNEHLQSSQSERINKFCAQWGVFALNDQDREEVDKTPEPAKTEMLIQKVRPLLEPLLIFFSALCRVLQEGENELTARDAVWLGLIDEIIEVKGLQGRRAFGEFQPDPPNPELPKNEATKPE
jgi:ATP-dependent protease ClpP protease subunit